MIITISRDSGFADRLRSYKVELDDTIIGMVGDGEKKSFDVKPGDHVLRMTIDWGGSNKLEFRIAPGESLQFKCASKARGAKVLLAVVYATILSQRYIKLEQVGAGSIDSANGCYIGCFRNLGADHRW